MKAFLKKNWWIFIAAEIVIISTLTFLCFHKNQNIVDTPLDSWFSSLSSYNDNSWYLDERMVKKQLGKTKSVDMIYGPCINMKKGSYTITVQYQASPLSKTECIIYV